MSSQLTSKYVLTEEDISVIQRLHCEYLQYDRVSMKLTIKKRSGEDVVLPSTTLSMFLGVYEQSVGNRIGYFKDVIHGVIHDWGVNAITRNLVNIGSDIFTGGTAAVQ